MYKIQDYRVLYNSTVRHPVICEGWYFTHMWKHLNDRIFSRGGNVSDHATGLTPPLFIEVLVPSQESEWSCIFVLGVRGHVFVC